MGKSGLGKTLLILSTFAFVQSPLLVNLQLLAKRPELLPDFSYHRPLFDLVTTAVAGLYLIGKWKHFGTAPWWRGFAAMALGYLALKGFGLYHDHTVYVIARASGSEVGGGAAMAHVLLLLALCGPLQLLSVAAFSYAPKGRPR